MSSAAGPATRSNVARNGFRASRPAVPSAGGSRHGSGHGTGEGDGARGGRPATHAPRRTPSASRHRDRADRGTGSGEEGGKPRDTRRPGHTELLRTGSATVGQPRTGKLRAALGHTPQPGEAYSVPHAIHPRTHRTRRSDGPRSSRLRQDGAASTAAPLNVEGKLRCASASGPRARACARTSGRGGKRRGAVTPPPPLQPRVRGSRAPIGARAGAAPQAMRMRSLPWRPVCGPRLSRSEGAVK